MAKTEAMSAAKALAWAADIRQRAEQSKFGVALWHEDAAEIAALLESQHAALTQAEAALDGFLSDHAGENYAAQHVVEKALDAIAAVREVLK